MAPHIRKAVAWLKGFQQPDGGWGEGGETYWKGRKDFVREKHTLADGLGRTRADERRRSRERRRQARHRVPAAGAAHRHKWHEDFVHGSRLPASSTCAITATVPTSRCGRGALPQPPARQLARSGMGDVGRPPGRLGVVVGLPQEAAILKRVLGKATPLLACAGAQPLRAAQGAAGLIARGAKVLLSFGFAGGLDHPCGRRHHRRGRRHRDRWRDARDRRRTGPTPLRGPG